MKTRNTLALLLALIVTLIAGCAADPTTPTTSTELNTGTLILSVNPSIAVEYDETGKVDQVTAKNEDAKTILDGYTNFENKEAKIVVRELVERIGTAGFLVEEVENEPKQIKIEIEKGSKIPHENFIREVAASVKDYLNESKLNSQIKVPNADLTDVTDYVDSDYDAVNPVEPKVEEPKPVVIPVNPTDGSDYDDTDYDGVDTNYDDTDYDGVDTDYDDTDYDGVDTNYDDTDYDGVDTDYDDTDYDGVDTNYDDTDYDGVDTDYQSDYVEQPVQPAPPVQTDTSDYSDYDDTSDYDAGSDYDDSDYGD